MKKILIVDDEQHVVDLVEAKLRTAGYETIGASNGREALEQAGATRPDLILLDVLLPGIDGFEVCRRLKGDPATKAIPIIFLSSKLMERDVVRGLELGADDYIIKPFSPRELAARVKHLLESKSKTTGAASAPFLSHLEKKIETMAVLQNIAAAMNSMHKLNELLQFILEQALVIVSAGIGSIMIFDDAGNLRIANAQGLDQRIVEQTRIKSGEGISGSVAAVGEPLLITNIEEDGRFRRRSDQKYDTKSLICVPLKVREKTIGVLNVNNKETGDVFNQDDLEILMLLSNQAAVAVDNAELYRQMTVNLSEYQALKQAITSITHSRSLPEMIDMLLKQAAGATNAAAGMLFLVDEKSDELYVDAVTGHVATGLRSTRLRLGEGVVGSAAGSKKPVIVNRWDGQDDPLRDQLRNLAGQPLAVNGGIIGLLAVADKVKGGEFNQQDLSSLELLSGEMISILNTNRLALESASAQPGRPAAGELPDQVSRFCSAVAHELRAPLTSIQGFSEILLDKLGDKAGDNFRHYLQIINNESTRLSRLIDDLLNISKLEVGQVKLDRRPTQLKEVVDDAVALMINRLSDFKLDLEIPDDLSPAIVDRDKMSQIFINLLANAANYSQPGNRIVIKISEEPDQFIIAVTDFGVGISPEHQKMVFEKFYRVDNKINHHAQGTGLGLAIVKHLVEKEGGQIWVKSAPDQGSTFWFTLPKGITPYA